MKKIIAWDLGATKCAAAVVEYNVQTNKYTCQKEHSVKLTDCSSLENLVSVIEQQLGLTMSAADAICIGAAGQYDGAVLQHASGYPYPMHFANVAEKQQWAPLAVIHDYAPIVCATFTSYMQQSHSVTYLNDCKINPQGRRIAFGVGTGLGLKDGLLFANGDFWLGENEIGHVGISIPPAANSFYKRQHDDLMLFLQQHAMLKQNQPITFENILSGQGIVNLHKFLYPTAEENSAEIIGAKMQAGLTPELMALFAWYLGLFVGTVQLAFMPEGGIWITGGVILNHLNLFDNAEFFHGIEASPAYLSKRQTFPLGVLCDPQHAFMGGAYYAVNRLLKTLRKNEPVARMF